MTVEHLGCPPPHTHIWWGWVSSAEIRGSGGYHLPQLQESGGEEVGAGGSVQGPWYAVGSWPAASLSPLAAHVESFSL